MARGRCPNCGASVDFVKVTDSNGFEFTVPLDIAEEPATQADRYLITEHNPLRAVKVAPGASRGMPDHRYDCPGHNAGR